MAVVAAGEFEDPVRPVKPLATRTALMAASVPEDTSRTCWQPSTRAQMASASRTSPSVGAPKVDPRAAAAPMASVTAGWAWPRMDAP